MRALEDVWLEREKRADFRAGQICAVLANIHRDEQKRREPYAAEDFFPALRHRAKIPTPERVESKIANQKRLAEKLKAITVALGGKILRADKK